jgi:hypothetical protein
VKTSIAVAAMITGTLLLSGALENRAATNYAASDPAASEATADSTDVVWARFHDDGADLEIAYPAHWEVVVAEARRDSTLFREHTVLLEGELHKFTFVEPDTAFWPGYYQIIVLANPHNLDLGAFFDQLDLSDLWEESVRDTVVADQAARTWIRWGYDALYREYLLMTRAGAVQLLYEEHSSNDPDHAIHLAIYERMTGTLKTGE